MTTETTESVVTPVVVEKKPRKPRTKMTEEHKSDHHKAKDLLVAYFAQNKGVEALWTGLFPGKQVRVLSNLLLDYVPGYLEAFSAVPPSPDVVARCEEVLRNAAPNPIEFRKKNVPLWKAN